MLSQIKNLLKGGKQKRTSVAMTSSEQEKRQQQEEHSKENKSSSSDDGTTGSKRTLIVADPNKLSVQPSLTAQQIFEQERIRKRRLPSYAGLERFEIIEKLGDGAFSIVYKARDSQTGKLVAIKVVRKHEIDKHGRTQHLHASLKKKPRATERANIMKEVQVMQSGKHQNLVQLLHFSESDDHYFLVMELCRGGELFHQIVKLTYFSEDLARHVILQVAHGIRHLHEECGVVHRDIKPENILFEAIPIVPSKSPKDAFDEDKVDEGEFVPGVGGGGIGLVKIADFGLSKVIWDQATGTPCGTVGYTAPEIVRDQKYSKSVDMWALGCVLYTMLCGFPPFYDESIPALTHKVAKGQYTFLSPWWDPISDAAKDLITHLLCVDADKRYTVDEFLRHPWITQQQQHFAPVPSPMPIAAIPSEFDTQTTKSNRRRKDAFSPGVASIKEILDITYAVQRIGEEKARKLGHLTEENEEEEEDHKTTHISRTTEHRQLKPFALDLDKATILKNRKKVSPVAA
ncbi:kinase-like domain-containing protein [Zychaea mexicana]|uniref:kinase-like domain-containing protein n=1 Tax=Zychaea mexicana TaxID=64656 RepID=UPI0022FEB30D|nr:kinase-like domain-containing protein [Zychaea mexicana]KAI9491644.1 kinase-like domain-containing protein [Zychaea mexicana]